VRPIAPDLLSFAPRTCVGEQPSYESLDGVRFGCPLCLETVVGDRCPECDVMIPEDEACPASGS
jgi:hypothetical protein